MAAGASVSGRIARVLDHLGIGSAHFAACMSGDWGGLVGELAGRVRSLSLVGPHFNKGVPDGLGAFEAPVLVVSGAEGPPGQRARDLAGRFAHGELLELPGYFSPIWADTVADNLAEVSAAVGSLIDGVKTAGDAAPDDLEGEFDGISYSVSGSGPPLVLLPLSLAPSQWTSLIDAFAGRYCVVLLGGPLLGAVALLEERAAEGYGEMVARVLAGAKVRSGGEALEVGCGSGALSRGLARWLGAGHPVVASDLNPYLLSEAGKLADGEGLSRQISFEQANAEALPFGDGRFELCFSSTVIEEANADKMLAEMARVAKPGGHVAAIARAVDMDWWINVPAEDGLVKKLNARGPKTSSGASDGGCADGSLYRRLGAAGLTAVEIGPRFAIYRGGERLADVLKRLAAMLDDDGEVRAFHQAIERGREDGSLFVAEPFHCALGRK